MTEQQPARVRLSWIPKFLDELEAHGVIRRAVRAAGIAMPTAYDTRERHADFAQAWDRALIAARKKGGRVRALCKAPPPEVSPPVPAKPAPRNWRNRFFEALAETSNVSAAAARADVAAGAAYKLRREDPDFAARWLIALHEGYDMLELELLGHLRHPQPGRRMDVSSALRLLAAHRETVERRRALVEEEDEQALLDSIDRFIDGMCERRAANSAIPREAEGSDGAQ